MSIENIRPWEYWAMDSYEYALIQDLTAAFNEAVRDEKSANQRSGPLQKKSTPRKIKMPPAPRRRR